MRDYKVIAIDFDGTLWETDWPRLVRPILPVIEMAKARKAAGDKLILWTCREGAELDAAVEACREQGLEFDTVLDNCMGYGSTGVACVHTGRRFIGIEKDEEWFRRAKERIEAAEPEKQISMEIPTLADLTEGDDAKH